MLMTKVFSNWEGLCVWWGVEFTSGSAQGLVLCLEVLRVSAVQQIGLGPTPSHLVSTLTFNSRLWDRSFSAQKWSVLLCSLFTPHHHSCERNPSVFALPILLLLLFLFFGPHLASLRSYSELCSHSWQTWGII